MLFILILCSMRHFFIGSSFSITKVDLVTSIPACRKTLCAEKPCVPKKIVDTLTLNISTLYTHRYLKYFGHKSCSVATPKHFEPLPLEIYIRVVAIAPDLRRVPF
jgi:hypothetical protein